MTILKVVFNRVSIYDPMIIDNANPALEISTKPIYTLKGTEVIEFEDRLSDFV